MKLETHLTKSGYLLPSIHSLPPFFVQQPKQTSQALIDQHWTRIILGYARHNRIFGLRIDEALLKSSQWQEVFHNERINRQLRDSYLLHLVEVLVSKNMAFYDPPKQTRSIILCWRMPEEWAEVLHEWAAATGQLNTILTFYEIQSPEIDSELTDIPTSLLRRAIALLAKTGRAQVIEGAEGGGVRFFASGKS